MRRPGAILYPQIGFVADGYTYMYELKAQRVLVAEESSRCARRYPEVAAFDTLCLRGSWVCIRRDSQDNPNRGFFVRDAAGSADT